MRRGTAFIVGGLIGGLVVFAACTDTREIHIAAVTSPHPEAGDGDVDELPTAESLCIDGKAVDWPPGEHDFTITSTLPPGLAFAASGGSIALHDYFEPCAERSRILLVRASAGFCGSCRWHAAHTAEMLDDERLSGRVTLLDLVVSDEDNLPPTLDFAKGWRAEIDAPEKIALDPKLTFRGSILGREPLPHYIAIDTRTMRVLFASGNPAPESVTDKLVRAVATVDRQKPPGPRAPKLVDKLFTRDQWDLISAMKLEATPPADPTNEYADDPKAAALGKKLFSDAQLSPSGNVSCAKCHDPTKAFSDGVAQAVGVATGDRNSPPVALAAHARWQFWDGRADTLWMQALGPFENDKEFASSRLFVDHEISKRYASDYAAVFGAKYPLPNMNAWPASGKPGDASFDQLSASTREAATRVYVNIGKAIAAFERTLRLKPNRLDQYASGDFTALNAAQKSSLHSFMTNGCIQCHWGPRLTDDAFHILRFPTGRQDGAADRGRIEFLDGALAKSEFVASSKWSDAPWAAKLLDIKSTPKMEGAFKTPTLRGLPRSAPYGHGGMFATLAEVTKHYGTRGVDVGDDRAIGDVEPWVPEFDANAQRELTDFLDVLDGAPAP